MLLSLIFKVELHIAIEKQQGCSSLTNAKQLLSKEVLKHMNAHMHTVNLCFNHCSLRATVGSKPMAFNLADASSCVSLLAVAEKHMTNGHKLFICKYMALACQSSPLSPWQQQENRVVQKVKEEERFTRWCASFTKSLVLPAHQQHAIRTVLSHATLGNLFRQCHFTVE